VWWGGEEKKRKTSSSLLSELLHFDRSHQKQNLTLDFVSFLNSVWSQFVVLAKQVRDDRVVFGSDA
jgi:hypothetical protein